MNKYKEIYFMDDEKDKNSYLYEYKIIGGLSILDELVLDNYEFVISIENKNNSIGHDSILDNYAQVSPGCGFGGYTNLKQGANVGICSSTLPNTKIGEFTIIGAGAVVTKDIANHVTAVGVPAKVIKER